MVASYHPRQLLVLLALVAQYIKVPLLAVLPRQDWGNVLMPTHNPVHLWRLIVVLGLEGHTDLSCLFNLALDIVVATVVT